MQSQGAESIRLLQASFLARCALERWAALLVQVHTAFTSGSIPDQAIDLPPRGLNAVLSASAVPQSIGS